MTQPTTDISIGGTCDAIALLDGTRIEHGASMPYVAWGYLAHASQRLNRELRLHLTPEDK